MLRRLVITEEENARVFKKSHSAPFSGHAGRDNTLRKIKERFYWSDYHKDTMEMVSYKFYLFNLPMRPLDRGFPGVRTTIAKHHGRYKKSYHLCQDGVE